MTLNIQKYVLHFFCNLSTGGGAHLYGERDVQREIEAVLAEKEYLIRMDLVDRLEEIVDFAQEANNQKPVFPLNRSG